MADINQYVNSPDIQNLQKTAQGASATANDYSSAAALLPAKLKDAIQAKLDYNSDIVNQRSKALADYTAAPSASRLKYQDIFNPFQREALVSGDVSSALGNYQGLTDILNQRMGNVNDLVGAGTGAFNAQTMAAQNAAGLARQNYMDAVDLGKWTYEQTHKSTAGGGGFGNIDDLIKLLGMGGKVGGGTPAQRSEPEPMYSPVKGEGATSTQGQWIYHNGEWMINTEAGSAGGSNNDPAGLDL